MASRMPFPHRKEPCAECPWRRDASPGKFPPERYRELARTAYDMSVSVFACHMSKDAKLFACAGFLLQSATHNLTVRMAFFDRRSVSSPVPLFGTYREMAIANGVAPDDPSLARCRDDQ
jgi:hypothetical protein